MIISATRIGTASTLTIKQKTKIKQDRFINVCTSCAKLDCPKGDCELMRRAKGGAV